MNQTLSLDILLPRSENSMETLPLRLLLLING
jgi:hypothetical protein